MQEISDSPAKHTRAAEAAASPPPPPPAQDKAAAKAAGGSEAQIIGEVTAAEAAARAPEAPKDALLALIEHLTAKGLLVQEGTRSLAEKGEGTRSSLAAQALTGPPRLSPTGTAPSPQRPRSRQPCGSACL